MILAVCVIDRAGLSGLTLEAVASEVGLARATLLQRFGSKRGCSSPSRAAGRRCGEFAAREAARRHRSPLRALTGGLVDMSFGVASPEAMANQLAFLRIDLSDPEFHAVALAHTAPVGEEIRAPLDRAVTAGEADERPAWPKRCRQPTTAH